MYKSRLQEFCHRRKWSLPEYSSIYVDGPPHNPSFKGSVFVNGLTFTSSDIFHSSKEAHNQAAMKALLNFSYPSSSSSMPTNEYGSKEKVGAAKPQKCPVPSQFPDILSDTDRLNKLQHQNYASKNNLDSPVFTIEAEGPPRDIRYNATVVVDGKSFKSPTSFDTRKEAEQAALQIVDMFQARSALNETCASKSLLQELTQRRYCSIPTYKSTRTGPPHMPTFFSTVEVEGVEFHGKASSSKKEAEYDAAKIAYKALKDGGLHMYAAFSSSIKKNQAEQSTDESDIVRSKQKLILEDELLDKEILPTDIKVNNGMHSEFFPVPANKKMKMSNRGSSSSSPKKYPFSRIDDTSPGQSSGSTSAESGPSPLTKSQRIKKPPSWLEDYMKSYEE
ncbi:double-stranded RNA-binding motif protein [Medicago truncatula]|uniref:Double-stranded RNA-binding motif protein n=1 Tax=Medicago truncatula TaxID=3880 RepID=G7J6L7_MEDTR|nr:double-stranded RNA-binding motif protein [Medicago truncatula]